ncbi:MAG: threonine synthase, partial [Micromonosporaceae bacterium]
RTGGWMDHVNDDEIRDGIRLLARTTGVFAETAGGVVVATLKKLLETGRLDPEAETVIYNTGEGLKTLDAVAGAGPTYEIVPSLRAAKAAGLLGA